MAEKSSLTLETKKMLDQWAEPVAETSYLETGNIGFDLALTNGKGLPVGSSTLLWASPGCGKTTLFADISRRLIKSHKTKGEPFKVLYLAIESSDALVLDAMKLREYYESRDFIYITKPLCWRQIEMFYSAVLEGSGHFKDVKLIVVDSINNVLSDQNMKNSIADGDFGTRSRERSNFYSKFLPKCKEAGITSLFVSQVRQNQEAAGMFAEKKRAAVGDPDKHNVDVIIKASSRGDAKDASKVEIETAYSKAKVTQRYLMTLDSTKTDCKNRYCLTYPTDILMEKAVGAQNYYAVRKLLEFHGFLKVNGANYVFDKALCTAFNLPEKSVKRTAANDLIQQNIGGLVEFLKETDCYRLDSTTKVAREITEAEDTEEEE